jgi:hypothetical protein
MGQWARTTAETIHNIPSGYQGLFIAQGAVFRAWGTLVDAHPARCPYLAFVPIGDTATEKRLRWEANMMKKHGETVPGLDGNPWIGFATPKTEYLTCPYLGIGSVVVYKSGKSFFYPHTDLWLDRGDKVAFIRPGDTAREAQLSVMLSDVPNLHPTREGSERALTPVPAPAPETVELALQAGTPTLKVETWEEHLLRRHAIIGLRRISDGKDIAEVQAEPAQHRLTIPPDTDPVMGSFWRK